MSKFRKADLSRTRTIKTSERKTKSDVSRFGQPFDPDKPFSDYLKSLPGFLKATDLLELAGRIADSKAKGRALIWLMGAHPIKVGMSPILNDLIENRFATHMAFNGACVIHDFEVAFFGRTSEEISETLSDGSFGMVEESPQLIFEAVRDSAKAALGLGEGLGKFIDDRSPQHAGHSIFRRCYRDNIPATVHVAIGTDTLCQHPGFDGSLFGKLSHDDFLVLCESIGSLSGGVVLNIGSAVVMPEVFLKALTVARNIHGKIDNFTAANFDMIQHYRPNVNVVTRPVAGSGKGYSFTGHHEIMLPLLAAAIKSKYREITGR